MSNLTNVQERALALDRNISVTAGAGSGKTRILVERYLKIVLSDPRKVKRVIAFTFTNKAAGEMQERVAETVNERLETETKQNEKRKLLAVRDQLNSAAISTIHSFCARVLREFPIEAGLSPDFSELEDMQQIILKQEAINQVFETINNLRTEDEKSNWIFLFSHIGRKQISEILLAALAKPFEMNLIADLFRGMDEDSYIDFLSKNWMQMVKTIIGEIDFKAYARILTQLIANDSGHPKNQKGQSILEELNGIQKILDNEADELNSYSAFIRLADLLTTNSGSAYKNASQLGGKESWDNRSVDLLVLISEMCSEPASKVAEMNPGLPHDASDRLWFKLFRIILNLFELVVDQYNDLKQETGHVDFEDLQMIILQLLKNNSRVREELVNRYDFILVDEFQDTDNLQWAIIRHLAGGEDNFSGNKVFVVGDPKQSIYGFRSADIRIFREVKQLFAQQAGYSNESEYNGNVVFEESFRFLPRLNGFINNLFEKILKENDDNPFEVGFHPLRSMRDLPGKGEIELALLESKEDHVENEAEFIAQKIKSIIQAEKTCYKWQGSENEIAVALGDIAILLRQRTHLLEIEQALRKYDIPFKTAGGIGFWQKQEIFDFYHLLRFITNPKDDFALVAMLRSKMFLLSDTALFLLVQVDGATYWDKLRNFAATEDLAQTDRNIIEIAIEKIETWLALRDRIPLDQLLHRIMDDLMFETILAAQLNGDQLIANINKLIDQAQSFSLTGAGGLQDFLNHLNEVIEFELREGEAQVTLEDKSTVKIMTIHASKGLQFPVVILPFLNTRLKGKPSSALIDGEIGLATKLNSGIVKNKRDDHTLHNILKFRQRQKDIAEAKRLFYVAATRASNHLILSAAIKEDANPEKDSVLSWLQESFMPDNIDILRSEKIQNENFILNISKNPDLNITSEETFPALDKELKSLKKYFEKYQSDPEKIPAYLVPLTEKIEGRIFSATRIMTFLNNPEEYYHRYHLGFFEQDYESYGEDIYKTDHGILKGKILHRYFELAGKGHQNPDELLKNVLFEFDVFEGSLSNEIITEISGLVSRAYASEFAADILNATNYRNEIAVTTCLENDYFTGTLDRLYKNKDGLWEVVDYKTNRITEFQVESEAEKYNWQIKAYAFLLSRLYPGQEKFPVTLYFVNPDRIFQNVFNKNECMEIEENLLHTIRNINERFPLKDA